MMMLVLCLMHAVNAEVRMDRLWRIMLKVSPIFPFFYSPDIYLFSFLMNPFFSIMLPGIDIT